MWSGCCERGYGRRALPQKPCGCYHFFCYGHRWSMLKLCGFALKMDVLILNVSKFMGLPVSNVWAIVYEQGVQRCVSFVSNPEICNSVYTSSTAQGGGGSFKNRKPIGEFGCCESRMAERIHWWTERWLELCFLEWLQWLQWDVVWCSAGVVVVV